MSVFATGFEGGGGNDTGAEGGGEDMGNERGERMIKTIPAKNQPGQEGGRHGERASVVVKGNLVTDVTAHR